MKNKTIALVGDGVQSRQGLLKSFLSTDWEIIKYNEESNQCPASIAIGMPGALDWKKYFPELQFLQLPGAGLDGLLCLAGFAPV